MTVAGASVAVFGAYGHTGRFVVAELCRRGHRPVLCGRDAAAFASLAEAYPALPQRQASIDDAVSLDRAFAATKAVVNCAGPFLDTGAPVIEAALRARIHYLDLTAEQRAAQRAFDEYHQPAVDAGVVVLPAMAFYGGLGDLLATAASGDWQAPDRIDVAVALDRWHPTAGTRRTGARNHYPRVVVSAGRLVPREDPPPTREWTFPPPFGRQDVIAVPMSEVITISRHLRVGELHSHLGYRALHDINDPATPAPVAADASGRSAQRFAIEVEVRQAGEVRRVGASGRDIYAVSAPLVVEALQRVLRGGCRSVGALPAGAAFDARGFLDTLAASGCIQVH